MGQALYRKHRPKKLSEVVGQEHITKTLAEALKQGRISHAYLFTGPRGVGKTSIARILAHEINGLPYNDDTAHIDVIEIDAASNRRIDEIRELREKVHVAPALAKYKVYIIDEVHMLTREAFNALLKTLEEPPAHAVFILATTDAHKLPETIISRTQRYSFRPVSKEKVVAHLAEIAKQEKISISPEALGLLAEHGEGSFRDSISLLDQVSSHGKKVGLDDVQRMLGLPPADAVQDLLAAVSQPMPTRTIIQQLDDLYGRGYQAAAIAEQLAKLMRDQIIAEKLTLTKEASLRLLERLLEVPTGRNPERLLEIVLLEAASGLGLERNENQPEVSQDVLTEVPVAASAAQPPQATAERTEAPNDMKTPDDMEPAPEPSATPNATKKPPVPDESPPSSKNKKLTESLDAAIWPEVLKALKQQHNTLYGVVRMAEPEFSPDGAIKLAFAFAFHQKRLNEAGNRQKLIDIVEKITGQAVIIECTVNPKAIPPKKIEKAQIKAGDAEGLETISSIFGGGELLES